MFEPLNLLEQTSSMFYQENASCGTLTTMCHSQGVLSDGGQQAASSLSQKWLNEGDREGQNSGMPEISPLTILPRYFDLQINFDRKDLEEDQSFAVTDADTVLPFYYCPPEDKLFECTTLQRLQHSE